MPPLQAYLLYLLTAMALLFLFTLIYLKLTPYDELKLLRAGETAPLLSLGGAVLGVTLALASSIMHNDSYPLFLLWAGIAMLIQLLLYVALTRLVPDLKRAIADNNTGMAGLLGMASLAVGILNAACLY
ncbi:DUF350 domain-containing protein [Leeia aquatica]|uniref:DUF350 domain-containing protein n=1 Tax=Leeia aquatica TaxID=2725557 RepID=A0A847S803_9NEIS|nr:DUF350 domain-containing protein [Leeia aquatica]NLR76084.1 DUF350 domain-containing protein [Leeia aquatica]